MNIVYASDDNFAEIMGISILSLLKNNRDVDRVNIYIIDSKISLENKKKIETILNQFSNADLIWIDAINIDNYLDIDTVKDRGSIAQYGRLFIGSLLPAMLGKIIYLDCDTLVINSISNLWNTTLNEKIIAAALDPFSPKYRKNLNLSENDILFNSGVMVIDLNKWRHYEVEKHLINFIRKYNGLLPQGDQGTLNAVLSKKTKILHPQYNLITLFYDFTYENMIRYRRPPYYYSYSIIEEACEDPCIIHYTTSFLSKRAWIKGSKHPYASHWLEYKQISPWNQSSLRTEQKDYLKTIYRTLFKMLPQGFSIRVSALLQAYIRPYYERKKYKIDTLLHKEYAIKETKQ